MFVTDAEAFQTSRRLTREEGLFTGGSTGVNVKVALDVARRVDDPEAMVVTILNDTGERYLSKLYDDNWMRENQLLDSERVTASTLMAGRRGELPPLVSLAPSASVRQALNLMGTYNVSQIPVIEAAECVGSLSEGPLMARALADAKLLDQAVSEVMQPPFPVIEPTAPLDRVTALLSRETPAALVRQDGSFVGIVTRHDVLRHVAGIK
jgi:cystathionine beta-synthase